MHDTYLVNGVDLSGLAWHIEAAEGLQDAPDTRGTEIVIPSAHGSFDPHADPTAQRRRYGPGSITFRMWLLGVDPATGAGPIDEDDLSEYLARLDELQALFAARRLVIDHPRADGTRRAIARLAAPIRPVREPSSPWFGRFTAECTIPAAFWSDLEPVTVATPTGGVPSGTFLDLSPLACSAPITDAELRFGPGNNPSLIQQGSYFQYLGVIGGGRELLVPAADGWDAIAGAGTAWQPDDTLVEYGPGPGWLELDPTAVPFQVAFTHTGGSPMRCSVTARRKHLTS